MIEPSKFVTNLTETCASSSLIREDGKSLTLGDRAYNIFSKNYNSHHFTLACANLKNCLLDSSITELSATDRIAIYGRFKQIADKIRNKDLKQECNNILDGLEKIDPTLAGIEKAAAKIFEDIESAQTPKDIRKHTEKLCSVIYYYKDDASALYSISKNWHSFCVKNKSSMKNKRSALYKSNEKLAKLLLNFSEKHLLSKEGSEFGFTYYPSLLRIVLGTPSLKGEFQAFITNLKTVLDKHADNADFIYQCLHSMDDILSFVVFSKRTDPSEFDKKKLIAYREFFPIFQQHLPSIKDEKLIVSIKIHCANLPCPRERTNFPHLQLNKKEQLDVLITNCQKSEDNLIDKLIEALHKAELSSKDIHHLAKLVSVKSSISNENRLVLRKALSVLLKESIDSTPWDDYREVKKKFVEIFLESPQSSSTFTEIKRKFLEIFWGDSNSGPYSSSSLITFLKRMSKTKKFFQDQVGLDEKLIAIPLWHHATSWIRPILNSKEIQVRHEKVFSGAWFSTQRESGFGSYVLSFGDKITQLDPHVFIGFEFNHCRWRGVQKNVPLQNGSDLVIIGVPTRQDKEAQKIDKLQLVTLLKEKGYPSLKLYSADQVDFIRYAVSTTLGIPNLSDSWWGKERAYSEHQEKLRADIQSMEIDLSLLQPHNHLDPQSSIAKVVQSIALPFYKKPMPRNPSYQSSSGMRVELGSDYEPWHKKKLARIQNGEIPARSHHGAMHSTRVALWTQVLSKAYEKIGREKPKDPILLAAAGAMHDVARENEGPDYWDAESSEVLGALLSRGNVDEQKAELYVQTIREKDPRNGQFSTDEQRIVHDADCLEIIRVIGKFAFNKSHLCFYQFDPSKKEFCNKLLNEISDFIQATEKFAVRNYLEHHSPDFYGDLVRMLFAMEKKGSPRFPLIRQLIEKDMQAILSNKTDSSKKALTLI